MAPSRKPSSSSRKPLELHYASSSQSDHNYVQKSDPFVNIAELVYGFLSAIAIQDKEKKKRRIGKRLTSIKKPARKRETDKRRRFTQALLDGTGINRRAVNKRITSLKLAEPRSSETDTKRASESPGKSPNNDRAVLSKAKKEDPMDNRSFMQKINKYIKTGFEQGKRQATKYVRKALSLAVDTGYLIPADKEGKLFRVSKALPGITMATRRADATEREKRRSMRRGEEPKKNVRKALSQKNEKGSKGRSRDDKKAAKKETKSKSKSNAESKPRPTKSASKKKLKEEKPRKRSSRNKKKPERSSESPDSAEFESPAEPSQENIDKIDSLESIEVLDDQGCKNVVDYMQIKRELSSTTNVHSDLVSPSDPQLN